MCHLVRLGASLLLLQCTPDKATFSNTDLSSVCACITMQRTAFFQLLLSIILVATSWAISTVALDQVHLRWDGGRPWLAIPVVAAAGLNTSGAVTGSACDQPLLYIAVHGLVHNVTFPWARSAAASRWPRIAGSCAGQIDRLAPGGPSSVARLRTLADNGLRMMELYEVRAVSGAQMLGPGSGCIITRWQWRFGRAHAEQSLSSAYCGPALSAMPSLPQLPADLAWLHVQLPASYGASSLQWTLLSDARNGLPTLNLASAPQAPWVRLPGLNVSVADPANCSSVHLLSSARPTGPEAAWPRLLPSLVSTCALLPSSTGACTGVTATFGGVPAAQLGDSRWNASGRVLVQAATSATSGHICGLAYTGDVICWSISTDLSAQSGAWLGVPATAGAVTQPNGPAVDLGGRRAVAVFTGPLSSCAILESLDAVCWGKGNSYLLATGSVTDVANPGAASINAGGRKFVAIAIAQKHVCAVFTDFTAACWGAYGYVLGIDSPYGSQTEPGSVTIDAAGREFVDISALQGEYNQYASCAVFSDGSVACWGASFTYNLGNADETRITEPGARRVDIGPAGARAVQVVSGRYHTCLLFADASAACFGTGSKGQLGAGATTYLAAPGLHRIDTGGVGVLDVQAGDEHTCLLLSNWRGACFGNGLAGRLGNGQAIDVNGAASSLQGLGLLSNAKPFDWPGVPTVVAQSHGQVAVHSLQIGESHGCALMHDRQLTCWGSNALQQTGLESAFELQPGVVVPLRDRGVVSLSAGLQHTCAIFEDGSAVCWGDNTFQQCGMSSAASQVSLQPMQSMDTAGRAAAQIAAGTQYSCAVFMDGNATCWGSQLNARLGLPSISNNMYHPAPGNTSLNTSGRAIFSIAVGWSHTCAVTELRHAVCWGQRDWGAIGLPELEFTSEHVQEPGNLQVPVAGRLVSKMALGEFHSCYVFTDGSCACVGDNWNGQLGFDNAQGRAYSIGSRSLDVGGRRAADVAAQNSITCWAFTDGTAACSGWNQYLTLGIVTPSSNLYEIGSIAVPISQRVSRVVLGDLTACAELEDGGMVCWGKGEAGLLGRGDSVATALPPGPQFNGRLRCNDCGPIPGANVATRLHTSACRSSIVLDVPGMLEQPLLITPARPGSVSTAMRVPSPAYAPVATQTQCPVQNVHEMAIMPTQLQCVMADVQPLVPSLGADAAWFAAPADLHVWQVQYGTPISAIVTALYDQSRTANATLTPLSALPAGTASQLAITGNLERAFFAGGTVIRTAASTCSDLLWLGARAVTCTLPPAEGRDLPFWLASTRAALNISLPALSYAPPEINAIVPVAQCTGAVAVGSAIMACDRLVKAQPLEDAASPQGGTVIQIRGQHFGATPLARPASAAGVQVTLGGKPCQLVHHRAFTARPGLAALPAASDGVLYCLASGWAEEWGAWVEAQQPLQLTVRGQHTNSSLLYAGLRLQPVTASDITVGYVTANGTAARSLLQSFAQQQLLRPAVPGVVALDVQLAVQHLPNNFSAFGVDIVGGAGTLLTQCKDVKVARGGQELQAWNGSDGSHLQLTCHNLSLHLLATGTLQVRVWALAAGQRTQQVTALPLALLPQPVIAAVSIAPLAFPSRPLAYVPLSSAAMNLTVSGLPRPQPSAQPAGLRMPAVSQIWVGASISSTNACRCEIQSVAWSSDVAQVHCHVRHVWRCAEGTRSLLVWAALPGQSRSSSLPVPVVPAPSINALYAHPAVASDSPLQRLPVAGGRLEVAGVNIAPTGQPSDVLSIMLGGTPCTAISVPRIDRVLCTYEPGYDEPELILRTLAGNASYSLVRPQPTIEAVTPGTLASRTWLSGASSNVLLTWTAARGSVLGGRISDWHVRVGSADCAVITVYTHRMSCWLATDSLVRNGTLTLAVSAGPPAARVHAIVAQTVLLRTAAPIQFHAATGLGWRPGTALVLSGAGFGLAAAAVAGNTSAVRTLASLSWRSEPVQVRSWTETTLSLIAPRDAVLYQGAAPLVVHEPDGSTVVGPTIAPPTVSFGPGSVVLTRALGNAGAGTVRVTWPPEDQSPPDRLRVSLWSTASSAARRRTQQGPPADAQVFIVAFTDATSFAGVELAGIQYAGPVAVAAQGMLGLAVGPVTSASAPAVPRCALGQYLTTQLPEHRCAPCPPGRLCSSPELRADQLGVAAGYAVPSWAAGAPAAPAVACPALHLCLEIAAARSRNSSGIVASPAGMAAAAACAEGHAGVLCAGCEPGWYMGPADACMRCSGGVAGTGVALVACMCLIVAALCWMIQDEVRSTSTNKSDASVLKKVLITHLQVTGLCASLQLVWPQPGRAWFRVSDAVSALGELFVAPECLEGSGSAYDMAPALMRTALVLCLPLVLLACLALVGALGRWRATAAGQAVHAKPWVVAACVVTAYVLYNPVTRACLQLFACKSVGTGDSAQLRWAADLNLACSSTDLWWWRLCVGVPVLLAYTIGFPLGMLLYLRGHVRRITARTSAAVGPWAAASQGSPAQSAESTAKLGWLELRRATGFMWLGYRHEVVYWYEAVAMLRKVGVTAAVTVASPDGLATQVYLSALFLLPAFFLQVRLRPYEQPRHNALEEAHIVTALACYITALFAKTVNPASGSAVAAAVLAILLNVAFLAFWARTAARNIPGNRGLAWAMCGRLGTLASLCYNRACSRGTSLDPATGSSVAGTGFTTPSGGDGRPASRGSWVQGNPIQHGHSKGDV